jgi:excisionase family DNA binding protein
MSDKLLTVKQVAARVGLSVPGVHRLIQNKVLPAQRVGERMLLVKEADLALAAEGRRPRRGRPWKKGDE